MAVSLYQLDVDDDSPEIAYFPFVNLEPTYNITAGWQLLYTDSGAATGPGQIGVGTSRHYTSLNGASLLVTWIGMGIDIMGSVGNALYNVSLDGIPSTYSADPANTILASFDDLENTNHSLLLTTIITNTMSPDAFLSFDKARITYTSPAAFVNTTATSQAVADSDIAFMGAWSYVADSTGNSMHMSNSAGDRAETIFQGTAITIYGLTSSYSGNFTVTLDNTTTNLSALSSYNNSDSLLFYATDLSQDMLHHIAVINQDNRTLALQVGGVNITSFGNSTTSSTTSSSSNITLSTGTTAAIVLAVILFLVIVGIFYYACCVRRRARRRPASQHTFLRGGRRRPDEKGDIDVERVATISPPSGEELESSSLSTSKGYGFGLGLRRGFSFAHRKNKMGGGSNGRSHNGIGAQAESYPMTPQFDRDEKRCFINTVTEVFPVLARAPESEKLAPGWSNPVARTHKYDCCYKQTPGFLIPELRVERVGPVDDDSDDDADVKTLTSRQDETLAATLSLSPRTSEALAASDGATLSKLGIEAQDGTRQSHENQQPELLQVPETTPFRVDVAAIFGARKSYRDSGSGSSSSAWSKVCAKLYRRAHRDDGRQSYHTDRQETSGSWGPESVLVAMHQSGSAKPPSEAAGSGTYSFLDLASSHGSLRRDSKTTTTLSSTPAELGHGAREASARSESPSITMVRVERSLDDTLTAKPDAPSTASNGSHPSDNSGPHTVPSAPTMHTQTSSAFPFPVTIPPSAHIAHTSDHVPERHITPPPLPTPPPQSDQHPQIPQIAPPELALDPVDSPTSSVPFSVSDIHFRNSYSDYAGLDSRRVSASSALPPHPPLPHLDGSQASTLAYSSPPPYIVQRVLGLPMSPLNPLSLTSNNIMLHAGRPGIAPTQLVPPSHVGSLLGPRPRTTSTAGSVRGTAAPQLPMQGGRCNLRGRR
ncbi:hypothetical protein J3R82DRAFT_10863 [Butyriboletus roseoflavus]|nr:hypothetical protein J3R82DRAFT_10863 [Butyriboletus roseoflavus]